MNKKLVFGIIFAGMIAAGAMAFYMYNKPHRNIETEKAAFVIGASELYDEFELDESAANEKYLDQVIDVNGTIDEVRQTNEGNTMLILLADNALVGGVSATFEELISEPALVRGDHVRAKCRCTGMLMDVVLTNCFLVR